jgi:rRNA maturation endonuclease Nob1
MKRRGGIGGIRDLFSSLSSSISRNDQSRPLKYYCMSCGKEHRETACPDCGSKMKRWVKAIEETKSKYVIY